MKTPRQTQEDPFAALAAPAESTGGDNTVPEAQTYEIVKIPEKIKNFNHLKAFLFEVFVDENYQPDERDREHIIYIVESFLKNITLPKGKEKDALLRHRKNILSIEDTFDEEFNLNIRNPDYKHEVGIGSKLQGPNNDPRKILLLKDIVELFTETHVAIQDALEKYGGNQTEKAREEKGKKQEIKDPRENKRGDEKNTTEQKPEKQEGVAFNDFESVFRFIENLSKENLVIDEKTGKSLFRDIQLFMRKYIKSNTHSLKKGEFDDLLKDIATMKQHLEDEFNTYSNDFIDAVTGKKPKELFISKLQRECDDWMTKLQSIDETDKVKNKETSQEKKSVPTVAAVEEKYEEPTPLTPEELIDRLIIHDESMDVSETIKNDTQFNAWMQRIAKKFFEHGDSGKFSLEEWHVQYTEGLEDLKDITHMLNDETFFAQVFTAFETPEQKAFARKKMQEELEYEMVMSKDDTLQKIKQIMDSSKESIEASRRIKELEEKKDQLETFFNTQNTTTKIPGELVYDILKGPEAETEKTADLLDFLTDIDKNYTYYRGKIKDGEDVGYMRKMFRVYEKTRKDDTGRHRTDVVGSAWLGKIGLKPLGRWLGLKLRIGEDDKYQNHADMNSFTEIIKTLEKLQIVPSKNTDRALASARMSGFRGNVFQILTEQQTTQKRFEDVLNNIEGITDQEKEDLLKLYTVYIKNRGEHSAMQHQAKDGEYRADAVTRITENIETLESKTNPMQNSIDEHLKSIVYRGFSNFEDNTRNDFELYEIEKLSNELTEIHSTGKTKRRLYALASLEKISEKLKAIPASDTSETNLARKKISLQLSQAYVRLFSDKKEWIPDIMKHYENILDDESISKNTKVTYLNEAIKTLTEKTKQRISSIQKVILLRQIEEFKHLLGQLE